MCGVRTEWVRRVSQVHTNHQLVRHLVFPSDVKCNEDVMEQGVSKSWTGTLGRRRQQSDAA